MLQTYWWNISKWGSRCTALNHIGALYNEVKRINFITSHNKYFSLHHITFSGDKNIWIKGKRMGAFLPDFSLVGIWSHLELATCVCLMYTALLTKCNHISSWKKNYRAAINVIAYYSKLDAMWTARVSEIDLCRFFCAIMTISLQKEARHLDYALLFSNYLRFFFIVHS